MHIKRWLTTLFIITVTISGLGFFKFQQIQAAIAMAESFPEPSASVNTHVTEITQLNPSYTITGQIVAKQLVTLQNELPGIITKVNFTSGKAVKAGTLLLSLNISEESAQLTSAKATLKLAEQNFARMQTLIKQKKVSQQQYDQADAELNIAKASVANLKSIIAKKQIIAPFDGTLGLETYQKGQFLPAYTTLTSIVGTDANIWVDFKLPQTQQQLTVGDEISVMAISVNGQQQVHKAAIIAKNTVMQAQSRHLTYRAEITDGARKFHHNELVKVTLNLPTQQAVVVPNSAIVRDQFGAYVYLLEKDDSQNYRAKRISIVLSKHIGDEQIILSGIEAGQLIATEGSFKLREQLLVYPNLMPKNSLSAQLLGEAY